MVFNGDVPDDGLMTNESEYDFLADFEVFNYFTELQFTLIIAKSFKLSLVIDDVDLCFLY